MEGGELSHKAGDRQMMTLQPGDWSGREWQKVDEKRVDQRVVSAIDDLLVDSWQSLPQRTEDPVAPQLPVLCG